MRVNEDSKAERKKKTITRIIKWVLAVVVVLIVLVVFLVPPFVSSVKGRQIILAKINDSIDGKADFAELSMSWWKGIKIAGFSFNNNAGQTSVEVKQIVTKPHYASILMGNLSFGETTIDQPKVRLNLKAQPPAGYKRVGKPVPVPVKTKNIDLVMDVVINDGNLKVTDPKAKTVELSRINSKVNLRPLGQQTNVDLNMAVVEGGKASEVQMAGQITPKKQTGWTLEGTSGHFTVKVNDLDLASLGPIFELTGLDIQAEGRVSADLNSKVQDGKIENLSGNIKGKDLDITGPALKGDRLQTSTLNAVIQLQSKEGLIKIDQLQVRSDWADIQVSGVVPTTIKSFTEFVQPDSAYELKATFDCDLTAGLSQMPRTLGLKEGIKITSGRLTGSIEKFTEADKRKIHGQASVVGLAGTVEGKKMALTKPVTAEVEITSQAQKTTIDKLKVSAAFAKINATGSTEQLSYTSQVDLGKLQTELQQFVDLGPYQMAGELFSKGQVSIKKEKITAVGSSQFKNLSFSSTEGVTASEPLTDMAFAFDIEPQNNIVIVHSIKATATVGNVTIKQATLPLNKKAAKPMALAASADSIDLAKLQPFAVLFASLPQKTQLAGIADSNLSITSENDSYQIVTDSTKIKNFKLISPGKKPFEQEEVSLIAEVEVNPVDKTFAVKKLQLTSPQIKIRKGNFSKTTKAGKTKIKGQVDCEYDWSALSTVAGPSWPKGLKVKGVRKQTIDFHSEYPAGKREGLLANLSTKGKLGFDSAYYKGLTFSPTEAEIRIVTGLFTISQFSSKVNNGVFRFAGEADFKQKLPLLTMVGPIYIAEGVQLNDDLSRELLVYVNPIFAKAFDVTGVGNLNCERLVLPLRGASKKETQLIGTIWADNIRLSASDLLSKLLSLTGLSIREQNLKLHPTRFVLQNGLLRYEDMQIDVGDNPFNFKGIIGLDKSLNMTVTLPYTLKGRTARVGQETVGERIALPLKGTIDKPELDLGKLLEQQLRQRLDDELRKGLEGLFK